MNGKYVLSEDGERPVRCDDVFAWASWFEGSRKQRRVAKSYVGPWYVSTVFLGLDHGWGEGKPLVWETMVFKTGEGWMDHAMERCSGNREQALAMHTGMVERMEAMEALGVEPPEREL